jgi:hypothetical protein
MRRRSWLLPLGVLALAGCGAGAPCLYGPYCAKSHTVTVQNDCGEAIEWVLSEPEQPPESAWKLLAAGDQGSAKTRFESPDVHMRLQDAPDGDLVVSSSAFGDGAAAGDGPLVLQGGVCPMAGAVDTVPGG